MRIGYLECFSGIAGDMFLGALVDAGVEQHDLQQAADALHLGVTLEFTKVDRSGIQSTKARVLVNGADADGGVPEQSAQAPAVHTHAQDQVVPHAHEHSHADGTVHKHTHTHDHEHSHPHKHVHGRSLSEIRALIQAAAISAGARRIALTAFDKLGAAEAKIHGVPVETLHFHEVGAVDAIVDIVCGAVGADSLGIEAWHCSPVNTGSGFVDCAHGRFPVPAPATAELLAGLPVYADGPAKELTTPTGAALLLALGCRFDGQPALRATAIGYGAGSRNPAGFPNVLRLRIGEAEAPTVSRFSHSTFSHSTHEQDIVTVLECAIDDATPETLAYAAEQLLQHGALDVTQQAVLMKKGRSGTLLTVLCRPDNAAQCEDLLFRETTTLGVRRREDHRSVLERRSIRVATVFGDIRVKLGLRNGELLNTAPEFEDCREAAQRSGAAFKEVMRAASAAAWQSHPAGGLDSEAQQPARVGVAR